LKISPSISSNPTIFLRAAYIKPTLPGASTCRMGYMTMSYIPSIMEVSLLVEYPNIKLPIGPALERNSRTALIAADTYETASVAKSSGTYLRSVILSFA
jgi:hypothetical protein